MQIITDDKKAMIFDACERYHVTALYTFGSVNTERFNAESDIDFLVSFDMAAFPIEDYADIYFGFQYCLEEILEREVDLVTERSIKNPYFKEEVMMTRSRIYPQPQA